MRRHRALRSTAALVLAWVVVRGTILATLAVPEAASVNNNKAAAPPTLPSASAKHEAPGERLAIIDTHLPKREFIQSGSFTIGLGAKGLSAVSDKAAKIRKPAQIAAAVIAESLQIARGQAHNFGIPESEAFAQPAAVETYMVTVATPRLRDRTKNMSRAGSAWALVRGGGERSGLATNGQLGGSQIGARIAVPVSHGKQFPTFALHGRLSTALETPRQSEAGVGMLLSVKAGVPIQLIVERRIRLLQGARNAFAAIAATGFDDRVVVSGMRASGYAQAGIVGIRSRDAFVDGAFRLERTISSGRSSGLRLGGGVWGAAQSGIYRIDVGPRIARNLNIGGKRAIAALEWRQRVAGKASPPSGLTLTIGSDF